MLLLETEDVNFEEKKMKNMCILLDILFCAYGSNTSNHTASI